MSVSTLSLLSRRKGIYVKPPLPSEHAASLLPCICRKIKIKRRIRPLHLVLQKIHQYSEQSLAGDKPYITVTAKHFLSFSLLLFFHRAALQIWGAHVLLFVCHPLSCECPLICVRRRRTHTYRFYCSAITEDVPVPEERDVLHSGKVRRKGALFTTQARLSRQPFVLD